MTAITSYNGLVARNASSYGHSFPIWGEVQTTTSTAQGSNNVAFQHCGDCGPLPNPLPTGVTSYILSAIDISSTNSLVNLMVAKVINLGNLNIGTNTFTAGSSFPTVTQLNNSNVTAGPVWFEVTTALNATPGNFNVTYTNQAGTGSITSSNQAMIGSSAIRSCGWVVLNSGDTGVRSISAATQSSGTTPSGVITFWGIIPLAVLSSPGVVPSVENTTTSIFAPMRLGAGDQIMVFSFQRATGAVSGNIYFIGDS